MAYSESLALRVRHLLTTHRGVAEKKMFGGLGFLLDGNMVVGIWRDSLIARVGEAVAQASLSEPHVREFDVTGRPMRGWLTVEPDGVEHDTQLAKWLERAVEFVRTVPKKPPQGNRKNPRR